MCQFSCRPSAPPYCLPAYVDADSSPPPQFAIEPSAPPDPSTSTTDADADADAGRNDVEPINTVCSAILCASDQPEAHSAGSHCHRHCAGCMHRGPGATVTTSGWMFVAESGCGGRCCCCRHCCDGDGVIPIAPPAYEDCEPGERIGNSFGSNAASQHC
jgi:hypothetical protein